MLDFWSKQALVMLVAIHVHRTELKFLLGVLERTFFKMPYLYKTFKIAYFLSQASLGMLPYPTPIPNRVCGNSGGVGGSGESYEFVCPRPLVGRYLLLRKTDVSSHLEVDEVSIKAELSILESRELLQSKYFYKLNSFQVQRFTIQETGK